MLCRSPWNGHGCGQCTPCSINLRRIWTSRIMLEASQYKANAFLTLTYEPEKAHKTVDGLYNLNYVHLEKFWKNFRIRLDRLNKKCGLPKLDIRYYAVGEYGHDGSGFVDASGEQWNPHFHAALFNYGCLGKIQRLETGARCYCDACEFVYSVWPYGNISLDELNDTTSGYIAGYVIKKMTSRDDVRLKGRTPEAARMSQGIARGVVSEISTALKSEFGGLAFQYGDIPVSLKQGMKSVPLGRYLRKKIRADLGMEKINPETGEVTYGTPYETLRLLEENSDKEVQAVRNAIKANPSSSLYQKLDTARAKKASRTMQKIKNMEAKHSIGKSRGDKKL